MQEGKASGTRAEEEDKGVKPKPSQAAQPTESKAQPGDPRTTPQHAQAADAGRPNGLSSAQISAWLILQHHREVEISKWAAEHASSEQVKAFARDMAAEHGKMIVKLHSTGLVDKKSAEAELGEVLQELAQRIDKRLADENGRIKLGVQRNAEKRVETTEDRREQRVDDRKQVSDEREQRRDTRQDVREARRDNDEDYENEKAQDGAREKRRDLRDQREDVRETRRAVTEDQRANVRRFMREAMPFVRENLPAILEIVGDTVETAAERDARVGWIDFQRQVAQKHIRSVKQQLQEQSGADFDEAFIAYQVGAHMQMINTLEVAQNYVTSDVRTTVDQMLATTNEHLTHARQLMRKLEDPGTSSSAR